MSTIKVGDWVRSGIGSSYIQGIYQVSEIDPAHGASLRGLGYERLETLVRVRPPKDWPSPRKVPAAELWAWFHEKSALCLSEWGTAGAKGAWGVFEHTMGKPPIATGPTPLKAILAARKVRS